MALSCGMIAMIDDAIGRILAQLAARGLADDTIVIFTTDHGDFLGDHRLLLKGPAHYDGITHVPFIWAEPGTRPARTTRRARRHARYRGDHSRSRPHPALQRHPGREPAAGDLQARASSRSMARFDGDRGRPAACDPRPSAPPRMRTLVTRRWRMTIAHGDAWGELYDLANDPHEMDNLFDDPGHRAVRGELMEKLAYRQMELADRSPLPMGGLRPCIVREPKAGRSAFPPAIAYAMWPAHRGAHPEIRDVSQAQARADAQHLRL